MKCDICAARPVMGVVTMVVNQDKTTRRVCARCMQLLQQPSVYAVELTLLSLNDAAREGDVCPQCGTTGAQVRRSGRVGCKECYTAFDPWLRPLMKKIAQPALQREEAPAEETAPPAPPEEVREAAESPSDDLDALREEMFRAVRNEEYERAATLRDTLRARQQARGEEGQT